MSKEQFVAPAEMPIEQPDKTSNNNYILPNNAKGNTLRQLFYVSHLRHI